MTIERRKKGRLHETCAPSDLAFLLIIYFLVIAGFNVNVGFLVDLPHRDSARLVLEEDIMRFDMDSGGSVFFRGAALSIPAAEQEIRAAIAGNPGVAVVLSIDALAPWQQVVFFVELAQNLQVETFSFSMRERS
ncbi:MAG: biopolymer transporter ExbD [Treponema sp.]|nr:biopolymer transporter ExbD [Treponema sp.]